MRSIVKHLSIIYIAAICFGFSTSPAFAYIDPGTGSIVIQAIIAAFVSAGFTIKLYWNRIYTLFQSKFGKQDINSEPEVTNAESTETKD